MLHLRTAHSTLVSAVRLGRGWQATPSAKTPVEPLELFEFEACPYCRKVREVLTELDIAYICRPCPKGSNNRERAVALGGKTMFPFLRDPNTDTAMYQSEDIITYLMEEYGSGRSSCSVATSPFNTVGSAIASATRPVGRSTSGRHAVRTQAPELLELYNFEASPFCRIVRETLAELNIDHRVHNVGPGSAHRPELVARGGKMMVPYLVDPNTETEMYESADIMAYLHATYGIAA